jgi:hypothetical protein
MPMDAEQLIFRVLEVETRAARIEGLFAADPSLARMWRGQVSLTEACRSVGLEDIHVFEGDVIHRHLENRLTDAEGARGAVSVAELLRVIVSPGDLIRDTERVIERCRRAAVSIDDDDILVDLAKAVRILPAELRGAPTPVLGAMRAATLFRIETQSSMPSADRLIFMAAEHALRSGGAGAPLEALRPEALLSRMNARWIITPSIALTQGRFRAWSPGTRQGFHDLLDGISSDLDRTLGAMPILRRWREDARTAASGKHGKSRLRDLVELAMYEPILTSKHVREMLGVSERASLYLMQEAEGAGILSLITPRKSYRVWAQPQMAQLLRMRAQRSGSTPGFTPQDNKVHAEAGDMTTEVKLQRHLDRRQSGDAFADRTADALSELDAAMEKADAILAKYRRGDPTK